MQQVLARLQDGLIDAQMSLDPNLVDLLDENLQQVLARLQEGAAIRGA